MFRRRLFCWPFLHCNGHKWSSGWRHWSGHCPSISTIEYFNAVEIDTNISKNCLPKLCKKFYFTHFKNKILHYLAVPWPPIANKRLPSETSPGKYRGNEGPGLHVLDLFRGIFGIQNFKNRKLFLKSWITYWASHWEIICKKLNG